MRDSTFDVMKGSEIQGRNQSIDAIKVIAMIGVLSLHCNLGKLDNPVAFVLSRMAGVSIPLFFMVSGYLLINKQTEFHYAIKKIVGILKFVFICSLCFWTIQMLHHQEFNINVIYIFLKAFIQKGPFWMFWYFGAMCLIYFSLPFLKWCDRKVSFFFPKLLGILLCVDFIVFVMTYQSHFEYSVIQTFRIWNWLTYFSLGTVIQKYHLKFNSSILAVILSMVAFVAFVYYCKSIIGGVEYFFSTPLCMAYAFLLFIYMESINVTNSTIVGSLSKLFLPVYTFHYIIIKGYHHFIDNGWGGVITPLLDYIIITAITLVLCYGIMKIPFSEKVFKI